MLNALKKLFPKKHNLKKALFLSYAVISFLLAPSAAHAADTSSLFGSLLGAGIGTVLAAAIGWPLFVLNYILATILGLAIPLIAFFISVILQLNMQIVKTNMVGSGFTVTLSLANLGFVLAIIIIAIMTILRIESYALKKTLWKLVTAAVLVNFSLVICAAILNFSDTLSMYFLGSISPAGNDSSFVGFASTLAGSFGPQRILLAGNQGAGAASTDPGSSSLLQGAAQGFGSSLTFLLNLIFPTIFLAFAVIAMGGLFIMLLIRYVYLGILLILMPMAWLLWIFPATSGQWKKWWSKFIEWTMFAPIMLFFIWLALLTMGGSDPNTLQGMSFTADKTSNSIVAAISTVSGNILSSILGPLLQMIMMIAMVFAGLFMAKGMGITFAETTLKGATWLSSGIGAGVGGFAKRRGLMAGGAVMKSKPMQKATGYLRGVGGERKTALGRIASLPTRLAGRGLEAVTVATTEDLVKDAEKRLGSQTREQLENGIKSTFTTPEKLAATKLLFEKGAIEKLEDTAIKKDDYEHYGQSLLYKKIENQGKLANLEMLEALPDALTGDFTKLDTAVKTFVASLTKGDISQNKQLNDIFSGKEFMGRTPEQMKILNDSLIKEMAISNPQLISAIIPKLKGSTLENFGLSLSFARKEMTPDQRERTEDQFKKMMENNVFYAGTGPSGETSAAAPTPPSGGH